MIRRIIPAVLASLTSFGQTAPARPEFEVASIRPSAPPAAGQAKVGVHVDGARVIFTYLSLKDYIGLALSGEGISNRGAGVAQVREVRHLRHAAAGAAREKVADMMQALLSDRFKLKLAPRYQGVSSLWLACREGWAEDEGVTARCGGRYK